jgi:cytosolic 5'-nucleotidase 3
MSIALDKASKFAQDPISFEQKVTNFKVARLKNLEIVSAFDGTLTVGNLPDGSKISTFGLFRTLYSNKKYRSEAQALFDYYHPLEMDSNIEIETKNLLMEDWWNKHLSLIFSLGITKAEIINFAEKQEEFMRGGFYDFDHLIGGYANPITIFSAGLGDMVHEMLNWQFAHYIVSSNFFQFNEAGIAVGYYSPIIHSHNKTSRMMEGPQRRNKRNNCIVLGDSLADANMVNDADFDTVLRIGFCSNQKQLEQYQSAYDMVLPNEEPLGIITGLIKYIK